MLLKAALCFDTQFEWLIMNFLATVDIFNINLLHIPLSHVSPAPRSTAHPRNAWLCQINAEHELIFYLILGAECSCKRSALNMT